MPCLWQGIMKQTCVCQRWPNRIYTGGWKTYAQPRTLSGKANLLYWLLMPPHVAGGKSGTTSPGGRWNKQEQQHHINYLELLAGFLALQTFCKHEHSVHIRMPLNNSTAVSYIKEMGGCHSRACNQLVRVIWQWAKERNIWLSASHIPGVHNVVADTESRQFNDNKEWQPDYRLFAKICQKWGMPTVDLFASRINHQVPCSVSWRPDPQAVAIDAFSFG